MYMCGIFIYTTVSKIKAIQRYRVIECTRCMDEIVSVALNLRFNSVNTSYVKQVQSSLVP